MYRIGQNILMFIAKYRTKRKLQIFKNQIYGLERHKYFLWWQDYEKERRYRTGLLAQYILPTSFSCSDLPYIKKFSKKKKGTIKLILFMFPYVVLQKCYKVYLGSYTKCTNGLSKLWGHIQWMWYIYAFIYIPYNINRWNPFPNDLISRIQISWVGFGIILNKRPKPYFFIKVMSLIPTKEKSF